MQPATQLSMTENRSQSIFYGFFFFMSFLIWLVATVIMRLWGHTFFIPENNFSMGSSFLFSLVFLPLLAYALFRWKKVQPHQRRDAAICLAIPGMLLDVVTTYFFTQVFPNVLPAADGAFGAWLLWGYALVLITGFITGQKSKSQMV
ncbi:DUF5367 domain-containing protein [Trichocoleus sp. FACHB-90]|uniref:DUF5367 domain-containing protein n=1 Tax=Cyanophyceae TaxID=3028117 RepID=UPI001688C36C|nr:DUF5367 domain-containing protein [Trichocoleus sp. FACHB-90]MBD1925718.1 DUF5367 domain-containing protein [Trichocoleus sp. FACHB-90]